MSVYCRHYYGDGLDLETKNTRIICCLWASKSRWVAGIIGIVFIWVTIGTVEGQRLVPDMDIKTIVLDPGHGGNDWGAKGHEGTYEKDVTLAVAQKLATQLNNKYRVILTRSADYGLEVFNRTAVANHQKAVLFISIHTGGDFLHKTNGMSIFTYQEATESELLFPPEPAEQNRDSKTQSPWDRVQIWHKASSKQLAKTIYNRLCDSQNVLTCNIQQAPLLILLGADMPAVLLEIGYITNPQDEKTMNDPEQLSEIVTHIINGIEDFLTTDKPLHLQ